MSDDYAEERSAPTIPACMRSKLTLAFNSHFLQVTGLKTTSIFHAVSGKHDKDAKFDYSVNRQKVPKQGPIPAGKYWIQPSQMWENAWYKRGAQRPWGNFRITIHPYPGTETYKRGGFFIHGGTVPGSAGCIDLTTNMDKFVDKLTNELGGLPKCYIPLTVRYSTE